jgi:hypothetical protein
MVNRTRAPLAPDPPAGWSGRKRRIALDVHDRAGSERPRQALDHLDREPARIRRVDEHHIETVRRRRKKV